MSKPTERLDLAIDRTVREMLDVEPPAGLRGRVVDRLERRRPRAAWLWIAGPIAAAAIVVLAVMLPWRGQTRVASPAPGAAPGAQAPTTTASASPSAPTTAHASTTPSSAATSSKTAPSTVAVARPSPVQRVVRAAVAADEPAVDTTAADAALVAALDGPAPLVVERLAGPPSTPMKAIDVAPIRIAALEVNPLTDLPRERQHEE